MLHVQTNHKAGSRLRFVFSDGVKSVSLPADATIGDIAATWDDLAGPRHPHPLAIDVRLN